MNAVLRHQLIVLRRKLRGRVRTTSLSWARRICAGYSNLTPNTTIASEPIDLCAILGGLHHQYVLVRFSVQTGLLVEGAAALQVARLVDAVLRVARQL